MGKGEQVDAIHLNFSKVFDRVNHKILVGKPEREG